MTITSIDKGTVRMLLDESEEALGHIAMKHGIIVSRKHCTYSQTEVPVAFKFVVPERSEDGEAVDPKETEFRKYAARFGLQPDDYGKPFKTYTGAYQVCGIKPRGRKFNVLGKETTSGKVFKFPAQQVKEALDAAAKEEACG
jgi:hypothetical protein